MKLFIVWLSLLLLCGFFASCSDSYCDGVYYIHKVKVLENSTITTIKLDDSQNSLLDNNDTVFENLRTHFIDDISDSAMKVVLIK